MSLCIIKPCLGVNLFAADESGIQAGSGALERLEVGAKISSAGWAAARPSSASRSRYSLPLAPRDQRFTCNEARCTSINQQRHLGARYSGPGASRCQHHCRHGISTSCMYDECRRLLTHSPAASRCRRNQRGARRSHGC